MFSLWWCHCFQCFIVIEALKYHLHACIPSHFSCVWFWVTLWIVAPQAPLLMGFSWQEYWSQLPSPPPWYLPNPDIEPISFMSSVLAGRFFTMSITWETLKYHYLRVKTIRTVWVSGTHKMQIKKLIRLYSILWKRSIM